MALILKTKDKLVNNPTKKHPTGAFANRYLKIKDKASEANPAERYTFLKLKLSVIIDIYI